MSDSLFASLANEFGALLYPLERAMTVPGALEGMLAELGALPDTDAAPLAAALESIVAEKRAIDTLAEEATPSFDSIADVLTGAGARSLRSRPSAPATASSGSSATSGATSASCC